jgi:hypothetical protein
MKKLSLTIIFIFGLTSIAALAQTGKSTGKLKRADCFFGVHFDLHASEDITDAGKTLTPEMIDTFLLKVRPDFIQIDCKGHPGISSYPTKVGYHVKGFEKDPLKLFREITSKNNVALFMHYSGVWDGKVVKEHPDWAIIKANGKRSTEKTSFFSHYADTYLIPQLKELSDYGVDGAWIDGDCWATEPDYGEASLRRFAAETGITEIPLQPSDKYYPEFIEYTRTLFREYLKKYVDAIHLYNPGFQITSNWSFSSIMPEKVTIDVDYLSGDVTPQNGVYRSAFEARCLAPQGKPWDLMAWGFSWNGGKMPMGIKSAIQLKQEASEIMAMGGGVQFYFPQNRDLSIKPWLATMLSEIGTFCRQRQQYCHKAKAVPQIAMLYPTASHQRNGSRPYANGTGMLEGTMNLLLDGQHSVEILMEHHLSGRMGQYPLIIIPECNYLEPSFLEELKKYVSDGGNLLVIGTETANLFENELGVRLLTRTDDSTAFIEASDKIGAIRSAVIQTELLPDTKALSMFYEGNDLRDKGKNVSSSVHNVGKGMVAGVYFNAGSDYLEYKSPVLRDFISDIITELFPGQIVKINGSHLVHLTVNKLNGKMFINLVNIAGEHTNQNAIGYDEIPSLKNISVSIKTGKMPAKILLQPDGRELKFRYQGGVAKVVVPDLPIYSILEIIPQV